MGYAVAADLTARFGEPEIIQLTDRDGFGVVDAARVNQVLAEADAEIDGYLAKRYSLPLASVPPLLTRLACDIARETLYTDAPTDTVKDRAATARKILRDIATGLVELGLAASVTAAPAAASIGVRTRKRLFDPDCE